MKIKKGYTLSGFVDYIKSFNPKDIGKVEAWESVLLYNDFLKQPLKKEMFVNEVLHPEKCTFKKDYNCEYSWEMDYSAQFMQWQEAEKKVIFKGYQNKPLSIKNILASWNTIGSYFENTDENVELQNVGL